MNLVKNNTQLIFDFDSTFSQVEGLDELINLICSNEKERNELLTQIQSLTDQAMNGEIDFKTSITKRLQLIKATKKDIQLLALRLKDLITPSILAHKNYLLENKENVHILSNGFKDFIVPVIDWFGLNTNQVYANEFTFNKEGYINGLNLNTPLADSGGKPTIIRSLNLKGKIVMIGDGYNDYEVKRDGASDQFILFTENITRQQVVPLADSVAENFNQVLKQLTND